MPQSVLFYPLSDPSPPAKIAVSSLLIAMPLLGFASIVFVFLGLFYIICKAINLIMGDPYSQSIQNQLTSQGQ